MSRIGVSRAVVVWSLAIFLAQPAARAQEENFGEINFPISCSAAAQMQFNRAVAMLHSFYFPETVKAFTALAQQEPSCAMAYWGIAISQSQSAGCSLSCRTYGQSLAGDRGGTRRNY